MQKGGDQATSPPSVSYGFQDQRKRHLGLFTFASITASALGSMNTPSHDERLQLDDLKNAADVGTGLAQSEATISRFIFQISVLFQSLLPEQCKHHPPSQLQRWIDKM